MHDSLLAPSDADLLRDYADRGDGDAVRRLVDRYVNLVYAAAVRQLSDSTLADDVTQATFILMVRKAHSIDGRLLAGWLVNTARYVAREVRRGESRRKRREQRAAAMKPEFTPPDSGATDDWDDLRTHLDAALGRLGPADRAAISLRYLQGLAVPDVAATLGVSEAAAAKRLTRALAKLRGLVARSAPERAALALDALLLQHARTPAAPSALSTATASAALNPASPLADATARSLSYKATASVAFSLLSTLVMLAGFLYVAGLYPTPRSPAIAAAPAATPWQGRPIRVGYLISDFTATGPHWVAKPHGYKNQIRLIPELRDPSIELFPLIEPGTADLPDVRTILQDNFPGRPVSPITDVDSLRSLDVIVVHANANALPDTLAAIRAATSEGVGLLLRGGFGDVTPGFDGHPDVPLVNGLVRGQYGWNSQQVNAHVVAPHPLLGDLAAHPDALIRLRPNGAYGVLPPGAQGLLQVDHDDITAVGNDKTVDDPEFKFYPLYVSYYGKGKIVGCSFAHYNPTPPALQSATGGKFFVRCVRWLASRPLD